MVALLIVMVAACARPSTQNPVPADVGIAVDVVNCIDAEPDSDRDRLGDMCELALTRAFAPQLMMHGTRCTPPGVAPAARVPGGYLHAAQPVDDVVRLVYLPAYYRDCGWKGTPCIFVDCSPHAGDSEIIVIDVRQGGRGWLTDAVFLSAHCFGRSDLDCRWYRGDDLDGFEWLDGVERGAPIVWVSDARNANYPSRGACARGHMGFDGCAPDSQPYRFPVSARRNIGSRAVPVHEQGQPPGCVNQCRIYCQSRSRTGTDRLSQLFQSQACHSGRPFLSSATTEVAQY